MQLDFGRAAKKLESDNSLRAQKAKQRLAKDREENKKVQQQIQARQEEQRQQRLRELEAQEAERLQHEEDIEGNTGVWFQATLRATDIQEDANRTIKRSADKVVLPRSAEHDLIAQDAGPKNGALLFELQSRGRTHAGLLSFAAVEGTIGIPPAVAESLWGPGAVPSGQDVKVTYRKLARGTFVQVQPEVMHFQQTVGENVEQLLETALRARSTLTQGDYLSIPFADEVFRLQVTSLEPEAQVSVIDTDLEAEVELSKEHQDKVRAEQAAAARREAELQAQEAAREAQKQQEAEAAQAALQERAAGQQAALEALPEEPAVGAPGLTSCMFQLPDGTRRTRRALPQTSLGALFTFVDSCGAGGLPLGSYQLVTRFPRRVFDSTFSGTLAEAGVQPGQEVFMVQARP